MNRKGEKDGEGISSIYWVEKERRKSFSAKKEKGKKTISIHPSTRRFSASKPDIFPSLQGKSALPSSRDLNSGREVRESRSLPYFPPEGEGREKIKKYSRPFQRKGAREVL